MLVEGIPAYLAISAVLGVSFMSFALLEIGVIVINNMLSVPQNSITSVNLSRNDCA